MSFIVDAKGLACPQPVILAKKALSEHSEVVVLVDDKVSLANVKRLAASQGHSVKVQQDGGTFSISISREDRCELADEVLSDKGPIVVVISSNTMGRGEDVLGSVLMKSFIHTLTETKPKPSVMILFNTGVKLAVKGSEVLSDMDALAAAGVRILVCGTCLNYLELKDELAAGEVSNMYDIAQTMLTAGRIVQI